MRRPKAWIASVVVAGGLVGAACGVTVYTLIPLLAFPGVLLARLLHLTNFDRSCMGSFPAEPGVVVLANVVAHGAFAGGVAWLSLKPRRRRRCGHCVQCGYDLAGNCSGRCPECGTRVNSSGADGPA